MVTKSWKSEGKRSPEKEKIAKKPLRTSMNAGLSEKDKLAKKPLRTSASVVLSEKEKIVKKPLRTSVSVGLKGKSLNSTVLRECNFKGSSCAKTVYHTTTPAPSFEDIKKKVLPNWRQMTISKKRKEAKLKLDLIKDTAGFNDNMDSMRDFHKLIGS